MKKTIRPAKKRVRVSYQKMYRDTTKFGGNRELVILRDGEKCVACGLTRNEHLIKYGRDITVDHIDGKGYNSFIKNNELSNLQTICLRCHGKKDVQRRDTPKGSKSVKAILDEVEVAQIKSLLKMGIAQVELARTFSVGNHVVQHIKRGKNWAWLPEAYPDSVKNDFSFKDKT